MLLRIGLVIVIGHCKTQIFTFTHVRIVDVLQRCRNSASLTRMAIFVRWHFFDNVPI